MPLRTDLMESEIRKATKSFLPETANSSLQRSFIVLRNSLGESAMEPILTVWPLRSFFLRYRNQLGSWMQAGIQTRSRQEMIVASGGAATTRTIWARDRFWNRSMPWGTEDRTDLKPKVGDTFVDSVRRLARVVEVKHQPVDGIDLWLLETELL